MLPFRLGMEQNAKNGRPNLLVRLAEAVERASDLEDILERTLDAVTAGLGTDRASLVLFDDGGSLRYRGSRGLSEEYRQTIDGPSPWSFDATDPPSVSVENVEQDADSSVRGELLRVEGIAAIASFPLLRRGRLAGKLTLYFPAPRRLEAEEADWATLVCQLTAQALRAHRAEQESLRSVEEVRQARQAAETAEQNRKELLALVAHDLRNPINTLKLSLSLLLRGADHRDERLVRQLDRMGRAVSGMEAFIDCLSDVVRIQSGHLQIELDSEELTSILECLLQFLSPRAAERSQRLLVDVPLGLRVRADRERLTLALTHIVADAIRSTPTNGWIRLCGRRLSHGRDSMVEISVADNGPAIAAEELPRIFDHSAGLRPCTRGKHLGLAVAKGIVEAHGGTLSAENATGAGVIFRLTLSSAD
jgi:signal transduction histidine kinase